MGWINLLQNVFSIIMIRGILCMTSEIQLEVQEELEEGIGVGTLASDFLPPYKYLTPDDYFRLDSVTGDLYMTAHRMDRESLCPRKDPEGCLRKYVAIIGPEENIVQVTVKVQDINDNAPIFYASEIHLSVPEDVAVGVTFALDDSASDADEGINGEVWYKLDTESSFFVVNEKETSPVVVVQKELDRETQSSHQLILLAIDRGSPPQTGTATLVVEVKDVDDNCPTFSPNSPQTVSIPGNSPIGTVVTRVIATDADLGTNAMITYSFDARTSDKFYMDQDSGHITLLGIINTDVPLKYILRVLANGPFCPPVATQVTVSVLPVVSEQPVIKIKFIAEHRNQTLLLQENKPPTVLAVLELTKASGITGTLSIEGDVPFLLKPHKGKYHLLPSSPLDFEQKHEYDISLVYNDAGVSKFGPKTVIPVLVEDVNDNAPQFQQMQFKVEVLENNQPGAPLVQVKATDVDSLQNGKVVYRLSPDAEGLFGIDRMTGQLYAMVALDREHQEYYSIIVVAQDNGSPPLEATATVSIQVLDQNDNAPVFLSPSFIFFIPENIPLLARVGLVAAEDADKGQNGKVEVHVLNGSSSFVMDNIQGTVRCTAELDRERQDRYELWLLARDWGRPSLSSTVKVTVFVEDVNDNYPHIILPNSNLSCLTVSPDMTKGATITRIHAIDADSGINSDISYHIGACDPPNSLFSIDPHSGNITLAQYLLLRDHGIHRLLIVVRDGGRPTPLESTVWVNLLVNKSVEPCHVSDVPTVPPTFLPLKSKCDMDEISSEQAWLILMIGLSMIAFSFIMLLGAGLICLKQRTTRSKRKRNKSKDNKINLKLMENCQTDMFELTGG
ncbi:protocadherin-20 [Scleropages formosus]|nr:protocadherin-20-like [Scleropages formosus]